MATTRDVSWGNRSRKMMQPKDSAKRFKVPSEDTQKKFLETVQEFPNGIFQVSSVSQENQWYVFDFRN